MARGTQDLDDARPVRRERLLEPGRLVDRVVAFGDERAASVVALQDRRYKGVGHGVRDTVLSIIESSCPSSDRDRTLAPRPRVRCSVVSLVAGAGVAALRTHCRCCPFYGSQGCPSLACAARFVTGGSCARVLVISWPLGPRLPPQLALYHDAKFVRRTLGRSNFCHWSYSPGGRLRDPRYGAGAVLQFTFFASRTNQRQTHVNQKKRSQGRIRAR